MHLWNKLVKIMHLEVHWPLETGILFISNLYSVPDNWEQVKHIFIEHTTYLHILWIRCPSKSFHIYIISLNSHMSFIIINRFCRQIEGWDFICPKYSAKKCPWWETNPECLTLEALFLVTTLLRLVVFSLYKKGKRDSKY